MSTKTLKTIDKAKQIPKKYRSNYISVVAGSASPRNAIKAFCLECMGYNGAEVKRCETINCPLNMYRPYQPKEEE